MGRRYKVALLAAVLAVLTVPAGLAISSEPATEPSIAAVATSTSATVPAAMMAPHHVEAAQMPVMPDAAKLLLVGTALFGLAAFVRKAI